MQRAKAAFLNVRALCLVAVGVLALCAAPLSLAQESEPEGEAENQTQSEADGAPEGGERFVFRPDAAAYPDLAPVISPQSAEQFLEIHPSDTVIGDPNAPVTVMEFFSYRCPFCKRFHEGTYAKVYDAFVATGQVKFVKREYVLNRSQLGIELLAGAGTQCLELPAQRRAFADLMYEFQSNLQEVEPLDQLLPLFARVGLPPEQARDCMLNNRHLTLVFLRATRAFEVLGVSGTPTLFINGALFQGNWQNVEEFEAALNAAAGRVLSKPA